MKNWQYSQWRDYIGKDTPRDDRLCYECEHAAKYHTQEKCIVNGCKCRIPFGNAGAESLKVLSRGLVKWTIRGEKQ